MNKLQASYPGFKLGVRVADQFTCEVVPRIAPNVSSIGLHALKGISHTLGLLRDVKAFSVNSVLYTSV